jgi:hypothetical protein
MWQQCPQMTAHAPQVLLLLLLQEALGVAGARWHMPGVVLVLLLQSCSCCVLLLLLLLVHVEQAVWLQQQQQQ